MKIEEGKFYFIKDEFFDLIKEKELCSNTKDKNKRPCYYCFKDKDANNIIWFLPISSRVTKYKNVYDYKKEKYGRVDNIVFGYVEGEERAFLIQNMFPTLEEYVIEKYIKQSREVIVSKSLKKELEKKSKRILKLVEKGYRNLVFPDIMKIKKMLLEITKTNRK